MKTIEEMSLEELKQEDIILEEECFTVEMDVGNVLGLSYDKSKFQKGINKCSEVAGMFTALVTSGMTEDNAVNIILNMQTIDHNASMSDIDLEKAKIQQVIIDKN